MSQHIRFLEEKNPFIIANLLNIVKESPKTKSEKFFNFKGYEIKKGSLRYKVFSESLNCVECGLKGSILALEKDKTHQTNRCHFNLYGINENGEEILMTKDHIKPLSKGGRNYTDNMQTMCTICNNKKGAN